METIFGSPEFKAIPIYDIDESVYIHKMIRIARKYSYMALDKKYKKPSAPSIEEMLKPKEWYHIVNEPATERKDETEEFVVKNDSSILKEMMENNPAIGQLISSLSLGDDEDAIPF